MMCLGVCFLGSNFYGSLWASWTSWKSISFARLGTFSFIMFSNKFSISCSSSSPSGTPMIQMLEGLKLSKKFLSLSSFFWILVSSFFPVEYLFLLSPPSHWFDSQFPPLHCWFPVYFPLFHFVCLHFFLYFVTELSHFCEHPDYQCLNCACDRLALSSLLSCIFSGVLICSFIWAIFFCPGVPVTW